jgi:LETM1 and EF-hand domain-containing protein 1, mitochondrial
MIVEGVKHTVHGLKDFGADSKWLIQTKTNAKKFSLVSYNEEYRARNVRQDLIKMIPFSFFIVVPGAEALLPAYLKIFPNSLPS